MAAGDERAPGAGLTLTPLDGPFGVCVEGVDASQPLAPAIARVLREAWIEHKLVLIRDQVLDEPAQLAFAAVFGPRFEPPPGHPVLGPPGPRPARIRVSNRGDDGVLGAGEIASHSDHAFLPEPSAGSVLHAVELPERGGDTSWVDLERAYAELEPERRAALEGLGVWAFNPWAGATALRASGGPGQRYAEAEAPRVVHPLVRRHPISGRASLFVSMLSVGIVDGAGAPVDRALLRELQRHVERPALAYRHRWRRGDVIVFDNRATNHRRASFPAAETRLLYRVEIAGPPARAGRPTSPPRSSPGRPRAGRPRR